MDNSEIEELKNYAYEFSTILSGFLDVYILVDRFDFSTSSFSDLSFFCDDFEIDKASQDLIFRFGSNCICADGITRTGEISILGDSTTNNSEVIIKLKDYGVNNSILKGNIIAVKNKFPAPLIIKEANGSCLQNDGEIRFSEKGKLSTVSGKNTNGFDDDVFSYETESKVISKSNDSYRVSTKKSLTKKNSCEWISQGQFLIKKDGEVDQLLDFGKNNCDNEAAIEIDKDIFIFILN